MIRVSTANLYLSSAANINADQTAEMTTTAELASGKQINSPADNPVGAAEATLLQSGITQLSQYSSNQSQATNMLDAASSTITQATNVMQSVNSALVEAGNTGLTDAQRSAIAAQLQGSLNQLVGLANTGDGNGGFLFGGSQNSTPPFVQNGNTVSYVGDSLAPSVQISQTRTEQVKYPGSSVFMSIPTGNGTFATSAGSGNTGSGSISSGSVTNPSQLTGDNYTITIGAGGSTYSVEDTTTNTAVVTNAALSNPTTLNFAGMQMSISGTPSAGDTFTVAPSTNQSIFTTLSNVISALQTSTSGSSTALGQISSAVTTALAGTQQAISSLSTTQASMGAQLQELSNYGSENTTDSTQDQTTMSSIVDLNYAQAASALSEQETQYQAALQSYASISKLSLFNYIQG
jgi:flagellar hook-associated protein 3 FlgL